MASVKKMPGSKYWFACYNEYTGLISNTGQPIYIRRQRSTRLEDKSDAQGVANAFEQQTRKAVAKQWNTMVAKEIANKIDALTGTTTTLIVPTKKFFEDWRDRTKHDKRKGPKTRRNYSD